MYRHILIASDFSAPATAGARLAADLAPDATFLAIHVAPLSPAASLAIPAAGFDAAPPLGLGGTSRLGADLGADRDALRHRLQDWIGDTGLRRADGAVVEGNNVAHAIVEEATRRGADLVVLGARGHSRIEEVLLGSTAREVVRHAKADVLLAEDRPHAAPPRRIAVAVAFDESDPAAIARARRLADATGAEPFLLHVIGPGVQTGAAYGLLHEGPPAREDTRWLERGVEAKLRELNERQFGGRARVLLARGHARAELNRLAHEAHVDLLVMGHHESGILERLLLGNLPETVARQPPCSTLIVQARAAPETPRGAQ